MNTAMRRSDKQVTDTDEIIKIINGAKVCRLAMCIDNEPYIVPLNFGYEFVNGKLILYFHGAKEGRKINILKKNNNVCFEIDYDHKLIVPANGEAWKYSFAFKSVIAFGQIEFIDDSNEKKAALNIFMKHQTGRQMDFDLPADRLDAVCVYRMCVNEFTAKQKLAQ